MKRIIVLLFTLVSAAAWGADLSFHIVDVKNDQGQIMLYLFPDLGKESFPVKVEEGKPVCVRSSRIQNRQAKILCPDVIPGNYAVFTFHDENENGEVDHHWYGPPKEDIGFSGNAKPFLGPPDFKEAAFAVTQGNLSLTIHLHPFF